MAYVPVPKDLTKVKTKVMFNLTRRQLVCFSGGALVSVPLFFLLKGPLGNSTAALCMILVMLPFFMLGVYEKNGQPIVMGYRIKAYKNAGQKTPKLGAFWPALLLLLPVDEAVLDTVSERDG